MKYCARPYNHLHFDPGGNVRICSWTDVNIGNILEEDIEDIWHGEKAEKFRESIADGSFRFCRKTSCPFLENDSLEDLGKSEFIERAKVEKLPAQFNVANDFICNHSCPSCRENVFIPDEQYAQNMDKMEEVLLPLLNQATAISACGNGDLFASPYMMRLLQQVHPVDKSCRISLETNGALFNENNWKKISHLAEYGLYVAVTPNSYVKTTHYYLCGNHDSYDEVMKNLKFISELREQEIINRLEISIVLQDRNFLELPDFAVQSIEKFKADLVTVKPLYKWFALDEETYWFKDVLNPLHPYHQEYLNMMEHPALKNPKVYFWGAKNLHPAQKHPAYLYKEIADYLNWILLTDDAGVRLSNLIQKQGLKNIIIYGENQLTEPIIRLLQDNHVEIKMIMAKYPEKEKILGMRVMKFSDYKKSDEDLIFVMNYDKLDYIKRDFEFINFNGEIIRIDKMLFTLKENM